MRPNGMPMRATRLILVMIALAGAVVLALHSSGAKPGAAEAASGRLETAELEREASAARAESVMTRAVEARAATKLPMARVESLHARVKVERSGLLSVNGGGATQATLVAVPSLVTERIQADSVAIAALSVALTSDTRATAALEERLVAESKVRDAAAQTIAAVERERRPRCGRRCGMVLGAAGMIALGIAADHTRRLW